MKKLLSFMLENHLIVRVIACEQNSVSCDPTKPCKHENEDDEDDSTGETITCGVWRIFH